MREVSRLVFHDLYLGQSKCRFLSCLDDLNLGISLERELSVFPDTSDIEV